MQDRKIKHFEAYQDRLKYFAKALGLKIRHADLHGEDGLYIPSRNMIKVDSDSSESRELAVTLHELGHCIDFELTNNSGSDSLEKAYDAHNAGTATSHQLGLVMACERRAWANGKLIARRLKIRLGSWYEEIAKECLKAHKEN